MNPPNFTPGPLTVQALIKPDSFGIVKQQEPRLGMTGGTLLVGEAKTLEDAQLFAAASELYAALEHFAGRAQSWHQFHHGTDIACDELCACVEPARVALAKARGER